MIDIAPRLPGRFFCHTLPLPLSATQGKKKLTIEIRAMGRIYPYGNSTDNNFYFPMTTPSRGLCRAYTHTDPYFQPTADDDFGRADDVTLRPNNDEAQIAAIKARVLKDQNTLLYSSNAATMDGWAYITLLKGYDWAESPAYRNPAALEKVCQAIDGRYRAWKKDSKVLTDSDQQWEGFGRVGLALCLVWDDLQDGLDRNVTSGPTSLPNTAFEVGAAIPTSWSALSWANKGTLSRDAQTFHTGTASLKVTAGGDGNIVAAPASRALTGQGQFSYSVWVKTDGNATTPRVGVQFYGADGAHVASPDTRSAATGTTDWQEISDTVAVPDGATQFDFWFIVGNGESAWFDDLETQAPEPSSRRAGYRDMMLSSREYWSRHQRHYTNQAKFTAVGIYECNRGLMLLSPKDAWSEEKAKSWLYQVVGLEPWS